MAGERPSGLRQLLPRLTGLSEHEVAAPKVTAAVVLQEASELIGLLARPNVRLRLENVGFKSDRLSELMVAFEAAHEAVGNLDTARRRWLSAATHDAELSAIRLREELLAACRWNLRGSDAQAMLARITDSDHPVELAEDLRELLFLISEHRARFASDQSFDEPGSAKAYAAIEDSLRSSRSELPREVAELLDIRDRALSFLLDLMEELRLAGMYAYRNTTEARQLFASGLAVRRRRKRLRAGPRVSAS